MGRASRREDPSRVDSRLNYSRLMPAAPLEPHQLRQVAESFGTDAARYDRARPRYPTALVERIVAESPGPDLLDVGTGTGIAARQLQAAGARVLGVDPDARMAEVARRFGVPVEVATFEDWDAAGRAFDAVVAAQAWHWVDPAAGAAKAAQVLRPGGRLVLFWNAGQPSPEAAAAFATVAARVVPELPAPAPDRSAVDGYLTMCDTAAAGMTKAGFGPPERWRYDWDHAYNRAEWLDVLPTQGFYTRLPADRLEELLTHTGAALDALGGGFTMHYSAVAVTAAR
jgi:SAM-dependent methyltransferase